MHNLTWIEIGIRKPLAAFDSRDANVRAEIEVCRELPFADGNFKWTSSRDSRNANPLCRVDLAARARFIGHDPARHRYFQNRDEVSALLQMSFQSQWVITRIKGARGRRDLGYADQFQVILRVKFPGSGNRVQHSSSLTS